jgi:hypothetical protein
MSSDEMEYWTQKHKALAETVEMLAASAHDLRAVVEAQVARERARDERSSRYLTMLADVFKAWAEDHHPNGEGQK